MIYAKIDVKGVSGTMTEAWATFGGSAMTTLTKELDRSVSNLSAGSGWELPSHPIIYTQFRRLC